jgi:hypothetical protein
MSTDRSAALRRLADIFTTILLLLEHGWLVMFTISMSEDLISEQEYLESRCRFHNLDCSNPGRTNGAPIAIGVSAALMLLDLVLVTWRSTKRRRSFFVPLLCCIGQLVVIEVLGFVGSP